jgi:hypothetical protein
VLKPFQKYRRNPTLHQGIDLDAASFVWPRQT